MLFSIIYNNVAVYIRRMEKEDTQLALQMSQTKKAFRSCVSKSSKLSNHGFDLEVT